jgi:hypothetical protein
MTHHGSFALNIARVLVACGILLSVAAYGRDFPQDSKRGEVTQFNYPQVKIGKTVYHIPPGGRIFNEHNLIIMPAAMPATAQVIYRLDAIGQIKSIWLLTPEEIKKFGPAPKK